MKEIKTKICNKCKQEKSTGEFCRDKSYRDGFTSWCKQCHAEYIKKWCKNNLKKVKELRRKWKEANPKYREKYSEKEKAYAKQYGKDNPEKVKLFQKIWLKNNPNYHKERMREKLKNDPSFKLNSSMSTAIRVSLKGDKNGAHWEDLVNYTVLDLKKHLESTMPKGYTWNDYLSGELHLDHKIPISIFNINGVKSKGFKACWALENLQFLPALINRKKKNILFYHQMEL